MNNSLNKINLNKEFWDERYKNGYTGWDIGYISTPMKEYFDQLKDKYLRILIPGGGNGYEAEYLYNLGFKNVFLLDWSVIALENFKKRSPLFPEHNLINENFFQHIGKYDLIVEQTFFCAINPDMRKKYADKIYNLLSMNGNLAGLLFNCELNKDEPPFGGSKEEYENYFKELFNFKVFETAYNSIKPRVGKELFINLVRK